MTVAFFSRWSEPRNTSKGLSSIEYGSVFCMLYTITLSVCLSRGVPAFAVPSSLTDPNCSRYDEKNKKNCFDPACRCHTYSGSRSSIDTHSLSPRVFALINSAWLIFWRYVPFYRIVLRLVCACVELHRLGLRWSCTAGQFRGMPVPQGLHKFKFDDTPAVRYEIESQNRPIRKRGRIS